MAQQAGTRGMFGKTKGVRRARKVGSDQPRDKQRHKAHAVGPLAIQDIGRARSEAFLYRKDLWTVRSLTNWKDSSQRAERETGR